MFLINKEIVYFSLYEESIKISTVGFLKLQHTDKGCQMEIQIKSLHGWKDGEYPLLLMTEKDELLWGQVNVRHGAICEHKYLSFQKELEARDGTKVQTDKICGLTIKMNSRFFVASKWKKTAISEENGKKEIIRQEEHKKVYLKESKGEIQVACGTELKTDLEDKKYGHKWEKLCNCYRSIHPFGDNHIFIAVEPKDLVILENSYRKLINNSFLLHGFYNYRHIIVGPDRNQPLEGKPRFCLGVPGTYYEREKMVAIMFGFEGFECEGPVEIGKNGYYMREVNLL